MTDPAGGSTAKAQRFAPIYEAMRQSGMNDWVGGGDPQSPRRYVGFDQAGLVIARVDYGGWMGGDLTTMLQDQYVCRKPFRPAE